MKKVASRRNRSTKSLKRIARPRSLKELLKLPYKIELVPLSSSDGGGYLALIPLLKGCQSDGQTPDAAIRNLREAQKAWFGSALKHGDPIPHPQA